jgi:histidine triad (HIT) family protein
MMNECIFCKIINGDIPSKKLYEDDKVIVIMDVNPKVDGHALVIPKEHVTDFMEISDELLNHVYKVSREISKKLMTKLNATALTLGVNYGDSQVVKHFHMHLLPNYEVSSAGKNVEEVYNILKED